jgi:hypothetical protein
MGTRQHCGRIAAALFVTAIALSGVTATADADGPAGAVSNGPVSFFDQWIAHDSQLQLAENNAGTLTIGDGALNTDQWSVTWVKNPSDSLTITLATLLGRTGPGMGSVGDQYIATIQPDPSGFQLLYLHRTGAGQPVTTYCTPQEMKAPNAPAPCHT